MNRCILFALGFISFLAFAEGQNAPKHAHGVATLQVAVDANTLTLSLSSPLDNLLGFEHAPRNEQQKAAVRNMATRLRKDGAAFVPTPAAGCTTSAVTLDSPALDNASSGKPRAHENTDHHDEGGHADLDAEYIFTCKYPDKLHDVDVTLFGNFPNLRQVDVQVASPQGQSAATLTPTQRRISW